MKDKKKVGGKQRVSTIIIYSPQDDCIQCARLKKALYLRLTFPETQRCLTKVRIYKKKKKKFLTSADANHPKGRHTYFSSGSDRVRASAVQNLMRGRGPWTRRGFPGGMLTGGCWRPTDDSVLKRRNSRLVRCNEGNWDTAANSELFTPEKILEELG